MKCFNWIKAVILITALGLGLAACETVKPILYFDSELTLDAPATTVRGGEQFTFSVKLVYEDEAGEVQTLANQRLDVFSEEFGINEEAVTNANGTASFEVVTPLLPERVSERDAWIRVRFGGTVIEFADRIGRFADTSNARYFTIKQSAPGRNFPGLPGSK